MLSEPGSSASAVIAGQTLFSIGSRDCEARLNTENRARPLEAPCPLCESPILPISRQNRAMSPFCFRFHFLEGLALAHLGDWDAGNAVFARLRQSQLPPHVLWLPRAYLLNPKGGRRTVQGTVREYGGRFYLEVGELRHNVLVERRDRWCAPGEIDHANVMFCFGGTRAVHDA